MNSVNIVISYLLHRNNDNEEFIRQDLRVRGMESKDIDKIIATSRGFRKDKFKVGRMLTNLGIRTNLSVSDMLTYALVADNIIDAEAYLEATRNQDTDSIQMIAVSLADAGIPDAKSVGRIVKDIRDTAAKAHRRKKDKRARKAAPHRAPELEPIEDEEFEEFEDFEDFDDADEEVIDPTEGEQLVMPGVLD